MCGKRLGEVGRGRERSGEVGRDRENAILKKLGCEVEGMWGEYDEERGRLHANALENKIMRN